MQDQPLYPPQEVPLTFLRRQKEYEDVYTYVFTPETPIIFTAGMYCHMRVKGLPPEIKSVREFSFTSSPQDTELSFGIENGSHSPYQEQLLSLSAGDTVGLFKIKTHMTWPPPQANHAVFIANGIGVTPFRSMLRDHAQKKLTLTTTLLHVGRGSYLYADELKTYGTYVQTNRDGFRDALATLLAAHPDAQYYVAGSPKFTEDTVQALTHAGITRVESDAFKGLAEIF